MKSQAAGRMAIDKAKLDKPGEEVHNGRLLYICEGCRKHPALNSYAAIAAIFIFGGPQFQPIWQWLRLTTIPSIMS
jgi:hypothetical protein